MINAPCNPADTELARILHNRVERIEKFLLIEDKEKDIVPFILNPIQKDILTSETNRDVYVKPGQIGASSVIIADFLMDCLVVPGTISVIVSHEMFITERLLTKAQFFYDTLLERIPTIPKMDRKSANLKTFPEMHSSFYIGSAQKAVFGRGETMHNLLLDEYAFWDPDAIVRIVAPILDRVPLSSRVKILSTPNGEGNSFHEIYEAAKFGHEYGKSIFKSHFYPWYQHPEYQLKSDSPYVLNPSDRSEQLDLNPDEEKLVRLHNVTMDQIRWRRYQITAMESLTQLGDLRILFQQEFPEDDVSCFLTAGDMAYDSNMVNDKAKGCYDAPSHIFGFNVWFPVEKGARYLVSCDVGVAKESETVITVSQFWTKDDKEYGKHCASLGGLIMPEKAAELAISIARYYNNATITWDAASQGLAFASGLKHYGNIYRRRDVYSGRMSNEIGWLTTPATKKFMYSQMVKMLPNFETHDSRFVGQLRNMRYDMNKGRLFSVGMDDYHDSVGIAICCRESYSPARGMAFQAARKIR